MNPSDRLSVEDRAKEYARAFAQRDFEMGNHVNTRAESWLAGHAAGLSEAWELARGILLDCDFNEFSDALKRAKGES